MKHSEHLILPSRIRSVGFRRVRKSLAFAALSLGLALGGSIAHANNPYWDQHGGKPVNIQQVTGGSSQTLKFVEYTDGMLVAELEGGVGEISLPVSESMVRNLRFDAASEMSRVRDFLARDNLTGALSILRPLAYPLIKFHKVPANFTQLHVPIRILIDTLVRADELDEASDIINRIELDQVDLVYSESALQLMRAYLADGQHEAAAELANAIPVRGNYTANIRAILAAADSLRGAQAYEAVIPLYRSIQTAVPAEHRENIQMWLAYSLVLAERLDEATPMIEALEEPEPGDRLFSLYKLLQGSLQYRNGDYPQALDLLTRGFVRAQTSYVWVPEMLYLIGDCYAHSDDAVAARNVWTEIAVLYPDSPWGQRAATSLEALPEPETSAN